MKDRCLHPFLLPVLLAGLGLMLAGRTSAQNYTVLHTFTGWPSDGNVPAGRLLIAGNTLYGTTFSGSTNNLKNADGGVIFSINIAGSGYHILHSFSTDSDGDNPIGGLVMFSNVLFGVTEQGGQPNGWGTLFSIDPDGSGFNVVHNFASTDVGYGGGNDHAPCSGLLLVGNTLVGSSVGADFYIVNTDGSGFTFFPTAQNSGIVTGPESDFGLVSSGNTNTFFGVRQYGGTNGLGGVYVFENYPGVFEASIDIYDFAGTNGTFPEGCLVLSGNTLYGITSKGGTNNYGTIYSIQTDGSNFRILHDFGSQNSNGKNLDGDYPEAGLILAGNTLYGNANGGGFYSGGTIFSINTDGTDFTVLHAFNSADEGGGPWGGLILSGCTFYGTCSGSFGSAGFGGTAFSFAMVPVISGCKLAGTNLILTATNGVADCSYIVVTSTNLTLPVSQWLPLATNVLTQAGDFTFNLTNAADPAVPQRFYTVRTQ